MILYRAGAKTKGLAQDLTQTQAALFGGQRLEI